MDVCKEKIVLIYFVSPESQMLSSWQTSEKWRNLVSLSMDNRGQASTSPPVIQAAALLLRGGRA